MKSNNNEVDVEGQGSIKKEAKDSVDKINMSAEENNKNNDEKTNKDKEKKEFDEIIEKLKNSKKEDVINDYLKLINENRKNNVQMEKLERENSEYLDRYRRTLADIENLRKRTIAEKQDSLKYANLNILSDLLVVLDDFQRAIDSSRSDKNMDLKHFADGIEMIEKQFVDLLFKKYGVTKFCKKGDEFDPKIHLAMMVEEGNAKKEIVSEVFRNGYSLHDRVIRAAEVKVSKPKNK